MQFTRIVLSGRYQEIGPQVMGFSPASRLRMFRFDLFYEQVGRIVRSSSLSHVLVERRRDFSVPVFGGLEEIRSALERIRKSGKTVVYHAPEYEAFDCVLAASCSRRIMHPLGQVSFRGLAMPSLFFKKLLDNHQVEVAVIRRDRYKGAADRIRTEAFDRYAREQYQEVLSGTVAAMRKAAAEGGGSSGGFTEELLDQMLDGRMFTAPQALEAGMVDELLTLNELTEQWKRSKAREKRMRKRFRLWSPPRVAVVVLEGMIIDGGNRTHPLFGTAAGDHEMVKTLRALRKNKRVKGVVFRINSGGGSPTASENIVKELQALHRAKPLLISMGPVAGSGGYWLATTGRRVFALPTTLTGSIGVLTLYFNLSKLLEKYGITTDCIREGEFSDMGSPLRPLTEKERERIDASVEFLYQAFIDRVSERRKLTREKVHELGEGRVWLGKEAVRHKLVDQTGGLHDAVAHMKEVLGVEKLKLHFLPRQTLLMRMFGRQSVAAGEKLWSGQLAEEGFSPQAGMDRAMRSGSETIAGIFGTPLSIVRACLSVHGQMLYADPFFCCGSWYTVGE